MKKRFTRQTGKNTGKIFTWKIGKSIYYTFLYPIISQKEIRYISVAPATKKVSFFYKCSLYFEAKNIW